ncbi:FUSC family protein [Arthrobacter sp. 35W]|uniref:FUSC family protein n=1 Tax=Arthrobacter sp. 35W TaxID=1132441 RepID=UPI0003F5BBAC|nr:FUSC family protein [Arthrobacter sp. 35W]
MARTRTAKSPVLFLSTRAQVGVRRSASSILPAIQMTICAVGAYYFAERVLGHAGPLFAATSSLIALGFSREPRVRRVLEVGLGCTLGIAVGDLLLHWLGSGIWQAAIVLFFSIMLARFLDSGAIFTTQLALQSLLVVLLPAPAGGPFTRSLDAVVGGCFALAVTFLAPRDPRRAPQTDLRALLEELAEVLRECSSALSAHDSTAAWHALVRARQAQPLVDALRATLRGSTEIAQLSPVYRRYRHEVGSLAEALERVDLALRSSRVFARRLASAITNSALSDEGTAAISDLLAEAADAVEQLGAALSDPSAGARSAQLAAAKESLEAIAITLHPRRLGIVRTEGETVVMLLRPLLVDLLEAAGAEVDEARAMLPEL